MCPCRCLCVRVAIQADDAAQMAASLVSKNMVRDNIFLEKFMSLDVPLQSMRSLLVRLARPVNDFPAFDLFRRPRSRSGSCLCLFYSEVLLLFLIYGR